METCPWEEIHDFKSYNEFESFVRWMSSQEASGIAAEVPVAAPYHGLRTLKEKWFLHRPSKEVWRLVWPDAPFHGVFEPVSQ
jgi:hypothetical protein